MDKIVEYRGIRKLVGAILTRDDSEALKYGDVFPIAGTSRLSKTTASSSETKSYDNFPAIVIDSEGEDTIAVDVSAVPYAVQAKITGQYYDDTLGMYVEGAGAERPYVAIGYITEDTNGNEVYVWRNKGKFALPGEDHATKDSSTTSNGQQLTYTGINTVHEFAALANKPKKTAKGVILETAKELTDYTEETFFEAVQDIDKAQTHKVTPTESNEDPE